jgi:acyl carrier protein
MNAILTEIHRRIESILELSEGSLQGNELLSDLPWDSMCVVLFMAMADKEYSVNVPPSRIADAKSVPDLVGLIQNQA